MQEFETAIVENTKELVPGCPLELFIAAAIRVIEVDAQYLCAFHHGSVPSPLFCPLAYGFVIPGPLGLVVAFSFACCLSHGVLPFR